MKTCLRMTSKNRIYLLDKLFKFFGEPYPSSILLEIARSTRDTSDVTLNLPKGYKLVNLAKTDFFLIVIVPVGFVCKPDHSSVISEGIKFSCFTSTSTTYTPRQIYLMTLEGTNKWT
jgi:hypothetical protein